MPELAQVTDRTFEESVLQSPLPVFVEFYLSTCGTCKMLEYTLVELQEEFRDKAKLYKINVQDNPETVGRYSILGAPTLLLFYRGDTKGEFNGPQEKEILAERLRELCSS